MPPPRPEERRARRRVAPSRPRCGALRVRVLLINPSYPFEEFPRLLVTLALRRVGAARGGARGRDPRPAARAHHARRRSSAACSASGPQLVGITSVTLNHHIAELDRARWCASATSAVPIVMGGPHVSFEIEGSFRDLPGARLHRDRRGRAHHGRAGARARRPHGRARRARPRRCDRAPARSCSNAPRPLEDDLDTLPDPGARPGAARALPRLRQPRERGHEPRLPLRVRLLLGAGLDRAQGALPHAVAVRRRDRGPRAPTASPRSRSRTISSRSTASTSWRSAAS